MNTTEPREPQATPSSWTSDEVPAEWSVGDVFLGIYEVAGVLGQGGMGTVYRVHHRGWGLDLAVKSPNPSFIRTEEHRNLFVQEAETWVNLGLHPHITCCHYVRSLGGIPRLFAECVEGGSLAHWMSCREFYERPAREVLASILDISIQIAWGLQHAHRNGLVHQDVKPANILMTADGTAKVTDFGLARAMQVGRSQAAHAGCCTPEYASREQLSGLPLTRAADVWSWAVTVMEMFIRLRPLEGSNGEAPTLLRFCRDLTEEDGIVPIPAPLADILQGCFGNFPEERPQDMNDLADRLRSIYQEFIGLPYSRSVPLLDNLQSDALNNRAVSLVDLEHLDQARGLFEQALRSDPYHVHATYNRGLLLWREGRLTDEELILQIRHAQTAQQSHWEHPYLLGWIHIERGDAAAALDALAMAATQAGNDPDVTRFLAQAEVGLMSGARAPLSIAPPRRSEEILAIKRRFAAAVEQIRGSFQRAEWMRGVSILTATRGLPGYERAPECLALWAEASPRALRGDLRGAWLEGTLRKNYGAISALAMVPRGQHAAAVTADGVVRLWDLSTARCIQAFPLDLPPGRGSSVALAADLSRMLAVDLYGTLYSWNLADASASTARGSRTVGCCGLAVTPDGCLAVTIGADGSIYAWEQDAPPRPLAVSHVPLYGVSLTANGGLVASGSAQGRVTIQDLDTLETLRILEDGKASLSAILLDPGGRILLAADVEGGLRLWDVVQGSCRRVLQERGSGITCLAMTPDGRVGISGDADGGVRIWDLSMGRCLREVQAHPGGVTSVAVTANGQRLLSGGQDQKLHLWQLDWELIPCEAADWDPEALPCLEVFLSCHWQPEGPVWTPSDFNDLLTELGHWGYGWLRPEGVAEELDRIAAAWKANYKGDVPFIVS